MKDAQAEGNGRIVAVQKSVNATQVKRRLDKVVTIAGVRAIAKRRAPNAIFDL